MKKLTQKLVLSVVTMALVVIALGTSTFAWFTLTNTASVGTFSGQVVAGTGIEVSLDNTVWYNGLTSDQMQDYLFDGGFTWYNGGTESSAAKYPSFSGWSAITSKNGVDMININETSAAAGSYIEFNLYFRSQAPATINWASVSLGGLAKSWIPDVPFKGSTGEDIVIGTPYSVSAKNGARVSVTGTVASTSVTTIYQEAAVTGSESLSGNQTTFGYVAGGQAKYWEAKNSPTTFASYVLGETASVVGGAYSVPATNAATTEPVVAEGAFFKRTQDVSTLGTSGVAAVTLAGPTSEFYTGMVTVRVWLDGWDADTYNSLFKAPLSVSLVFNKA